MVRIAEGLGAKVTRFTRSPDDGFALDPDRVGRAITERTRVVVVTNVHNPTGARATDDVLGAVARVAARRGVTLLVDEVYAPLDAMCGPGGVWPGSARKLGANVVVTSSLTKAYGLGSHRIGWVLGPPDVVTRAEDAQTSNLGHLPASWAAIGAAAFDHLPALAERARDLLAGKRARVEAWVKTQPHLTWSAPDAGLYGLATDARGGDLRAKIERGAAEHDVLAVPGVFFEMPSAVRIAWSIDGARLDEGLARLARALA
jgi:aspartate/methionine/tyrosine aminotransferase